MARRISKTGGHRTTFNVEKPKKDKPKLDLETIGRKKLERLYHNNTVHGVLAMFGLDKNSYQDVRALYTKLDALGIEKKVPNRKPRNFLSKYSKEELEDMYAEAGTLRVMAKKLGTNQRTLRDRMDVAGAARNRYGKRTRMLQTHNRATRAPRKRQRSWDDQSYDNFLTVWEQLDPNGRTAFGLLLGYSNAQGGYNVASKARKALDELDNSGNGHMDDGLEVVTERDDETLNLDDMNREELSELYYTHSTDELLELFDLPSYYFLYQKLDEFGIPRKRRGHKFTQQRKQGMNGKPGAAPVQENMVLVPVGDGTFRLEAR